MTAVETLKRIQEKLQFRLCFTVEEMVDVLAEVERLATEATNAAVEYERDAPIEPPTATD